MHVVLVRGGYSAVLLPPLCRTRRSSKLNFRLFGVSEKFVGWAFKQRAANDPGTTSQAARAHANKSEVNNTCTPCPPIISNFTDIVYSTTLYYTFYISLTETETSVYLYLFCSCPSAFVHGCMNLV